MASLDEILNAVMPPLVVIAGLAVFGYWLREPLGKAFLGVAWLINFVKKMITGEDKLEEMQKEMGPTLYYE
jgi:hypothetical protein